MTACAKMDSTVKAKVDRVFAEIYRAMSQATQILQAVEQNPDPMRDSRLTLPGYTPLQSSTHTRQSSVRIMRELHASRRRARPVTEAG